MLSLYVASAKYFTSMIYMKIPGQAIVILALCIVFLSSCVSIDRSKYEKTLEKIMKDKYGVAAVSIRESKEKDSVVLAVNVNFKKEPDSTADFRFIGANAAQSLYDALNDKEKKTVALLKITVETPAVKSDVMDYRMVDLKETALLLKHDEVFFNFLKRKDYDSLKPLISPDILVQAGEVIAVYEKLCDLQGTITKTEMLGFNYVQKTNSRTGAKVPVFIAWFNVNHGAISNEYKISIRMDTKMIVAFSINEG